VLIASKHELSNTEKMEKVQRENRVTKETWNKKSTLISKESKQLEAAI
jgi:hypothetical protein